MSNLSLHESDLGTAKKTLNVYVFGFVACIVLTLIPFAAVMMPGAFEAMTVGLIVACAVAQLIIQLFCFLRLNYDTEQAKLNVKSMALCLFTVFVVVLGSLWIMSSLNYRMM